MTLSVADARDAGRVRELVNTVNSTSRKRAQADAEDEEGGTTTAAEAAGAARASAGDAVLQPPAKAKRAMHLVERCNLN
jgi:hypothetical protein